MAIDGDEVERRIRRLRGGKIEPVGTVSLATGTTSTAVTHPACSSTSHVSLTPTNAAARTEGIPQVTAGNGAFTLTHSSSASARTYSYAIFTPSLA